MEPVNYFIENTGEKYCLRVPVTVDGNDTECLTITKDEFCKPNPESILTFYDGLDGTFDEQKWVKKHCDYTILEAKEKFHSEEPLIFEGKIRLGPRPGNILNLSTGPCYNSLFVDKTSKKLRDYVMVDVGLRPEDIARCHLDIPGTEFKYRVVIDKTKFKYQTIDLKNNILQTSCTDILSNTDFFSMLVYYMAKKSTSFDVSRILNELTWTLELHFEDVKHDYILVYEGMDVDKPFDIDITHKSDEKLIVEVTNSTDVPRKQLISIDVTDFVYNTNTGLKILY